MKMTTEQVRALVAPIVENQGRYQRLAASIRRHEEGDAPELGAVRDPHGWWEYGWGCRTMDPRIERALDILETTITDRAGGGVEGLTAARQRIAKYHFRISPEMAEAAMWAAIHEKEEDMQPLIRDMPDSPRRDALIEMAYQLGAEKILGESPTCFVNMCYAIRNRNWDDAAREALDSEWGREFTARAGELAIQIREDRYATPDEIAGLEAK